MEVAKETKAEERVKESIRDKREISKGKGNIQVDHEETKFLHRSRTRFSTKNLIEEPTSQNVRIF